MSLCFQNLNYLVEEMLLARDLNSNNFMFHILTYILYRPFNFLLKSMLTHRAIIFGADGATKIETTIGMYKQFY
jgi:hypothetical protein